MMEMDRLTVLGQVSHHLMLAMGNTGQQPVIDTQKDKKGNE
jgi:hypothetical protein